MIILIYINIFLCLETEFCFIILPPPPPHLPKFRFIILPPHLPKFRFIDLHPPHTHTLETDIIHLATYNSSLFIHKNQNFNPSVNPFSEYCIITHNCIRMDKEELFNLYLDIL